MSIYYLAQCGVSLRSAFRMEVWKEKHKSLHNIDLLSGRRVTPVSVTSIGFKARLGDTDWAVSKHCRSSTAVSIIPSRRVVRHFAKGAFGFIIQEFQDGKSSDFNYTDQVYRVADLLKKRACHGFNKRCA